MNHKFNYIFENYQFMLIKCEGVKHTIPTLVIWSCMIISVS